MHRIRILLGDAQSRVKRFIRTEEDLFRQNKACQDSKLNFQGKIDALKREALAMVKTSTDVDAKMDVYVRKTEKEDAIYDDAANELNKMRDSLLGAQSDLKLPTLTGRNFGAGGSGRITQQKTKGKTTRGF